LQAGVISNPANSEGAGTVSGATMQAVGNGIYRCTLSGNLGANTTARCCLINMITPTGTGFVTYQGVSGNGSYVWGVQYEQGALTSYIPTTATAVTRAVDRCGIASANMAPWFVSTVGSWFAEFVGLVPSPNNACIIAEPGTTFAGKKPVTVLSTTNFALGQYDGAGIVSTPNATTANVVARTVSTWTAGQAKAVLNGGAVATSATLTLGYSSLATNGVNFLTPASLASSDNLTGYIRRVQYWPRALSDTEMQQVTT
jgi:hypothetical protein